MTAYLAFALHSGVQALLQFLLPTSLTQIESRSVPLAWFISSFPTVAVLSVLWVYHRFVIAQDESADHRPPVERPALLKFLGNLGFTSLGMALTAFGVFRMLYELLRLPDERGLLFLPTAAGALVAGSMLWTYHQWRLACDPSA